MRLRLIDSGYPSFKKICEGRKWVGRVVRCGDGRFLGIINAGKRGKIEVYAATEEQAFETVAAKAFGFDNATDLRENNRAVRQQNSAMRSEARYIVDQALNHSNFKPLVDMIAKR